jgi:AraC-like DNA-binding protein
MLNQNLRMNFNMFINKYRVETFMSIAKAQENEKLTIEGMAYESGFNSKTVFNTYFKKETGLTPSQYLKQPV